MYNRFGKNFCFSSANRFLKIKFKFIWSNMKHPDYNSPSEIKIFLEQNNMSMQKKFGQNFLINPNARNKVVNELNPLQNEAIWEIGPGLGCMTEEILKRGSKLTVFEIDWGFIKVLHSFFEDFENSRQLKIVEGDVLKTWKKEFELQKQNGIIPKKLFGNLPYNIAATFIAETITNGFIFDKCNFTVQKEVVQRMAAKPCSQDYSAFSVLIQWGYDVHEGIELSPSNFWPRPNVTSQNVILKRKEIPYECKNPKTFVKLVHALFSSRRKTIYNNIKPLLLKNMDGEEILKNANLEKSKRAEELSVQDFINLSDAFDCAIVK